jgi:hypothetical protein
MFTATDVCGNWDAANGDPARFAVYPACPLLTVRNVQGNFRTPAGASSAWVYSAPPGAAIQSLRLSANMIGVGNWESTIYLHGGPANGTVLERCQGSGCPGGGLFFDLKAYGASGAQAIVARVRCAGTDGCSNAEVRGGIKLFKSYVTIADWTQPTAVAGGALAAPGWKSGVVPVAVSVNDNVGVKQTRALIDGVPRAASGRNCNYGSKTPCPNGADSLDVPLGALGDGAHTLSVQAVDAADNIGGSTTRVINVDNTPPVAPQRATLEGGTGWRATNRFAVRWDNPAQRFAPIAAARYELCPSDVTSDDSKVAAARKRCVTGTRAGAGITRIDDLAVPDRGNWNLKLWLMDAARNHNSDAAVVFTGLGFDPSPPTAVRFREQTSEAPARLRVEAKDPTSGIASGSIEARRQGEEVWRPLTTRVNGGELTAMIDDEVLPRGPYDLRATAVNGAGLQQGTTKRITGGAATIRLPVRLASRLVAGARARRCHAHHCSTWIKRRVDARLDRKTPLRGRLITRGKPLAGQRVEVWSRLATSGTQWERAATVKTGKAGRFRYTAHRGPARRIRFRYPGSEHLRGDTATVDLRVPAQTSLRVSRRNVINGEYAVFRGRVAGRWIPPEGTLVELQVYTRARWRTFAQPRALPDTRRWAFQYRFETIRGKITFRFRARIRRQSNYPFRVGHSRTVRVTVQGL